MSCIGHKNRIQQTFENICTLVNSTMSGFRYDDESSRQIRLHLCYARLLLEQRVQVFFTSLRDGVKAHVVENRSVEIERKGVVE